MDSIFVPEARHDVVVEEPLEPLRPEARHSDKFGSQSTAISPAFSRFRIRNVEVTFSCAK